MEEHRASQRRRALKGGKVVLSAQVVLDCLIRDISASGARIEFGAPTKLPDAFRLLIPSSNLLIPATPAWQTGLAAGIRFTGPGVSTRKA
jgi:hypothetical protein